MPLSFAPNSKPPAVDFAAIPIPKYWWRAVRSGGDENTVRRFIGMFAVAVWDCGARSLSLVRDRLGIKLVFGGQKTPCSTGAVHT
jgi:hypothetical protein